MYCLNNCVAKMKAPIVYDGVRNDEAGDQTQTFKMRFTIYGCLNICAYVL